MHTCMFPWPCVCPHRAYTHHLIDSLEKLTAWASSNMDNTVRDPHEYWTIHNIFAQIKPIKTLTKAKNSSNVLNITDTN